MSRSRTRSSKKKTVTIAVLVACLLLAAIGGTIAWMTVTDDLTNEFTVGKFEAPDKGPDDETLPDDGGDGQLSLNGYLWEPSWDVYAEHKLIPGAEFAKDPMVGIGAKSEDAYVYVYVENNTKNDAVYFTINDDWKVAQATPLDSVGEKDPGYAAGETYYSGGLFRYSEKLIGAQDDDSWTSKLFEKVYVDNDASEDDLAGEGNDGENTIKVTAYIHQATDGDGTTDLLKTADTWAKTQAGLLQ